jgi:hypothetical protein
MFNIKHIQLLSETEITSLYTRPEFNYDEQQLYFTLNEHEFAILNRYSNTRTKVYFILQLGYFKAKQKFFKFRFEDARTDVKYIVFNFFKHTDTILSGRISRNYTNQQKDDILKLFEYQEWSSKFESQTTSRICELLRYYPKSHSALRQLLDYFSNQKIIVPSYRKLQDMFTAAYSTEEKRLGTIVSSTPKDKQQQLLSLIDRDDGISQLNIIRSDQKDFKYTAVRSEIKKAQKIAELHEFAKSFIPTLKLSKNAVRYYADLVEQYSASRLRRLSRLQQLLHVICFIYHRYQQIYG